MQGYIQPITLFAALMLLLAYDGIAAKSLYRCDNGNGASYQDRPCATPEAQQRVEDISMDPVPEGATAAVPAAHGPIQVYRAFSPPTGNYQRESPRWPSSGRVAPRVSQAEEPQSFRCVASNGEVFYRHDRCPTEVNHRTYTSTHYDRHSGSRVATATPTHDGVTSERVSRKEACKAMNSINRSRRERAKDGAASTYERNLGKDPCR